MDQATHNRIVSFIWGIADDVLRDLFKRGKYPDVIQPMCVLRRMDAVLEPTKQAVLDTKQMLDDARITAQRAALADFAGQAFCNTSRFTLRDLKSRGSHQRLLADFEDYKIRSGTYLLFDDSCGTGGMLTVAEETLTAIGKKRGLQVEARLYGQRSIPRPTRSARPTC